MSEFDDNAEVARITIQSHRGALIAAIQVDLDERVLERFRFDLLEQIRSGSARTVIMDLAGVHLMDSADFDGIRRAIDMAALMGARSILCGIRPGVAASLVDVNAPTEGLQTCLNLDLALAEIGRESSRLGVTRATEDRIDEKRAHAAARDTALDSK